MLAKATSAETEEPSARYKLFPAKRSMTKQFLKVTEKNGNKRFLNNDSSLFVWEDAFVVREAS